MQGAKAYLLPVVAALVLLAYFLFAPSADDVAAPTPETKAEAPTTTEPAPRDDPPTRGQQLGAIRAAITDATATLPDDYVARQTGVLRGIATRCTWTGTPPLRIVVVGAPEVGALVETFEVVGDEPDEAGSAVACARDKMLAARLSMPTIAGRSTIEL
jgi:hypothetical protein